MKLIIIIVSILVLASCDFSDTKTYRHIDVQHNLVVLRREYFNHHGEFYVFNGTSSEWYYVNDEDLYNRTNVGDTLQGVNLYIYNYSKDKPVNKEDSINNKMQQDAAAITGAAVGAQ